MGYIVKIPKLGMSMQSAIILEWYVSPSDPVDEGDVIAEIESEKTTAEIVASDSGVLREVYAHAGDRVEPGGGIAIIAGADEDISELEAEVDPDAVIASAGDDEDQGMTTTESQGAERVDYAERPKVTPKARKRAAELDVDPDGLDPDDRGVITVETVEAAAEHATGPSSESEDAGPTSATGMQPGPGQPRATPNARRRARELGVDVDAFVGNRENAVVTASDVEALSREDGDGGRQADSARGVEDRELSAMRRTIAERVGQSYREAPHVTVTRSVGVAELRRVEAVAADYLEVEPTLTDLLVLLVSATLDEHPSFNATFEGDRHRVHDAHNIGVAVDIDRGLIAPVVSDVDRLSLAEMTVRRSEMTDRALNDEFTADDLAGGTFTVSNLGVLGIDSFTPIINPPQVGILGVNRVRERPVRGADGVQFEPRMNLDLSFDHRVVDGADAARFMQTLAVHVEDPWSPVLDRL